MQADHRTDFLIVGAGFSGLVVAERLAAHGWHCTVVDRRNHIGGNAHDRTDKAGVLVHSYGPHYFRTNSRKVREYLSRFTEWQEADYKIKSHARGRLWSFPVNLNTFEELSGKPSTEEEFTAWLESQRIHFPEPKNSEEQILSRMGRELYELFFEGYTTKQWDRHPRDLDASVCARIPLRTNRDDRYLQESFQALPADGYTRMFERMVDASPGVSVHLGIDFAEAAARWNFRHLVFTGPIDEYFDHRFGRLPYRSLRFENESFDADALRAREAISGKPGFWQSALQINFPEPEVPHTRIVEIKHATRQKIEATTIVREYPKAASPDDEPYYPVPAPDARAAHARYAELAEAETGVSFIGRLATYRYYNMDQVVAMALAEAEKLLNRFGSA